MPDPDESPAYAFEEDEGKFRVVDTDGSTILVCFDTQSAEQYVVLLNQAYRRGYKAGFRTGRKPK